MVIQKAQVIKKRSYSVTVFVKKTVIMASKFTFSQLIEKANSPFEYSLGLSG
jgi:hypothetical protein